MGEREVLEGSKVWVEKGWLERAGGARVEGSLDREDTLDTLDTLEDTTKPPTSTYRVKVSRVSSAQKLPTYLPYLG